jgi:hypothetical protein
VVSKIFNCSGFDPLTEKLVRDVNMAISALPYGLRRGMKIDSWNQGNLMKAINSLNDNLEPILAKDTETRRNSWARRKLDEKYTIDYSEEEGGKGIYAGTIGSKYELVPIQAIFYEKPLDDVEGLKADYDCLKGLSNIGILKVYDQYEDNMYYIRVTEPTPDATILNINEMNEEKMQETVY